ncbi:MAG: ATP-binding cassette domain-containing protein, partial [Clostridiales bacterium]|nr:ATP-binding cassette domain-containing protein [Clostridiales bacterium]
EEGTLTLDEGDVGITLENLTVSYDGVREVLKNVSMCLPARSFTALVGESGSGKSTIASVLSGVVRRYGGSARLGEKELSDVIGDSLMRRVALVTDRSYLFTGTVRENLLMGRGDAADSALWAALEQVGIADFFRDAGGLDAPLSEKAANLSGGQRQRVALARALLRDSSVYILDEAASSVDQESEEIITRTVRGLAKTKTVLLISHRLANAVFADRIFVLKDGALRESGNHTELMRMGGVYAELYTAQKELEQYA